MEFQTHRGQQVCPYFGQIKQTNQTADSLQQSNPLITNALITRVLATASIEMLTSCKNGLGLRIRLIITTPSLYEIQTELEIPTLKVQHKQKTHTHA